MPSELTEERPELAVYVESAGSAHTLSIYDADRLVGRVQAGRVAEFKEQEIPVVASNYPAHPNDTRRPTLVWHIS